jgi:phage repressor protein C with HTH and peptisase S24 domain
MSELSERIKTTRLLRGSKQVDIGKSVGVTSQAISSWERGVTKPRGKLLSKLAATLDVSDKWLLSGSNGNGDFGKSHSESLVVFIRFYPEIEAAAGHGCNNNFELNESYPLPREVVDTQSNIKDLFCVVCRGDSMEPLFTSGAILAVNPNWQSIVDGGVYVVRLNDRLRVKSLSVSASGIVLKSYNDFYSDEVVDYGNENFEIIGKVFWQSSKLNI